MYRGEEIKQIVKLDQENSDLARDLVNQRFLTEYWEDRTAKLEWGILIFGPAAITIMITILSMLD